MVHHIWLTWAGARRSSPPWGSAGPGRVQQHPSLQDQAHLDLRQAAGPGILGGNTGMQRIHERRLWLWTQINLDSGSESATER